MLAVQRFTVTGAIDAAFRVYRQHFLPLFLLSLVVSIPNAAFGVVNAFMQFQFQEVVGPGGDSDPQVGAFLGIVMLFWLLTFVATMVASMFGTAGATHIASQAALGRKSSLGDAIAAALRVFWPLLGATLLMTLAVTVGFFMFVVPGMIVWLGLFFIGPVVVIEGIGAVDALGRSWRLTSGRRLKLWGGTLLVGFLFVPLSFTVMIAGQATDLLGQGLAQQIIQTLLLQAISSLAMPVWYIMVVLYYYDARVEHDAFDVQMLARIAEQP